MEAIGLLGYSKETSLFLLLTFIILEGVPVLAFVPRRMLYPINQGAQRHPPYRWRGPMRNRGSVARHWVLGQEMKRCWLQANRRCFRRSSPRTERRQMSVLRRHWRPANTR
jgi:hypothetical protein